jgi:hypothetical protein
MNKQFDIYTDTELKNFIDMAQKELANRKNKRFEELVKNACDALNALVKEFPTVKCEINMAVECEYCNTDYDYWFDIFDHGDNFRPEMFVNY